MLCLRGDQRGLFEADHLWLDHVGRNTFYGFLAEQRGELFKDEEFAVFYSRTWGRPSVPPSLLATALLLQVHDRVSDEEARQRACFDVRWKVALGVEMESRPFAKSTLQLFRVQLILHEQVRLPFERSLEVARRRGFLKAGRKLNLALPQRLARDEHGRDARFYYPSAMSTRRLVRLLPHVTLLAALCMVSVASGSYATRRLVAQ